MGALTFDGSQSRTPVGYYTYLVEDDHWSWSDGVFELHGYEPDAVAASTELMLKHKHPDDMVRAFEVLETAIESGGPFSCYHRIIDANDKMRSVISVGRGVTGVGGKVEQVTGFFVDLTETARAETQAGVEAALVQIAQTRAAIDQAKGMIMLATGCNADEAFAVLHTCSSHKNVKLNVLAQRLVEEVDTGSVPDDNACRALVMGFLDGVEEYSGRTAS